MSQNLDKGKLFFSFFVYLFFCVNKLFKRSYLLDCMHSVQHNLLLLSVPFACWGTCSSWLSNHPWLFNNKPRKCELWANVHNCCLVGKKKHWLHLFFSLNECVESVPWPPEPKKFKCAISEKYSTKESGSKQAGDLLSHLCLIKFAYCLYLCMPRDRERVEW